MATMFGIEKGRMAENGDVLFFNGEFDSHLKNKYFVVRYDQMIIRDLIVDDNILAPNEVRQDITVGGNLLTETLSPYDYETVYHVRLGLHETQCRLYIRYPENILIGRLQRAGQTPIPGDPVMGYQASYDYTSIPQEKLPCGLDLWFIFNQMPSFAVWNANIGSTAAPLRGYEKFVPKLYIKALKIKPLGSEKEAEEILASDKTIKYFEILGPDMILF